MRYPQNFRFGYKKFSYIHGAYLENWKSYSNLNSELKIFRKKMEFSFQFYKEFTFSAAVFKLL